MTATIIPFPKKPVRPLEGLNDPHVVNPEYSDHHKSIEALEATNAIFQDIIATFADNGYNFNAAEDGDQRYGTMLLQALNAFASHIIGVPHDFKDLVEAANKRTVTIAVNDEQLTYELTDPIKRAAFIAELKKMGFIKKIHNRPDTDTDGPDDDGPEYA